VLSRFLKEESVDEVRMSGGKLQNIKNKSAFHYVFGIWKSSSVVCLNMALKPCLIEFTCPLTFKVSYDMTV